MDLHSIHIPPFGPLDATIAVVGESGGRYEVLYDPPSPFRGPSGFMLDGWFDAARLSRASVRMDNLYPYFPSGESVGNVIKDKDVMRRYAGELVDRLRKLPNLRVVAAVGAYSTYALTGRGGVLGVSDDVGIVSLRGSVLECAELPGVKVVPMIHPAWFLRGQRHKQGRSVADLVKVQRIAEGTINLESRWRILTDVTHDEALDFHHNAVCYPEEPVSIDIETWGSALSYIGFGMCNASITLPVLTKEQRAVFMPIVKSLCERENPKVTQNGHFDAYWLAEEGIRLNNWRWDTLCMHHALDAAEEHSLDHMASLFVPWYVYWKDEAKGAMDLKGNVDLRQLQEYNGKDCLYTLEIYRVLQERLRAEDMLAFYDRHYAALFDDVLRVMRHGVRVDKQAMKASHKTLVEECGAVRGELREMAGYELFATRMKGRAPNKVEVLGKDFSPLKLKKFFYEDLGAREQMRLKKRKEGKVRAPSLDEVALRKIALGKDEKARKAAFLVIRCRGAKKEADDMAGKWDTDGRMRCTYTFNTDAGRFASHRNPKRKGRNLQNVKRGEQRKAYLPDEGRVFLAVDGSQVEDRFVKMYCRSRRMVELANRHPREWDAHRYNASRIFGVAEEEVTAQQRHFGKTVVHASQRGMMGATMADGLLEEGVVMDPKECQRLIDRYYGEYPDLQRVYFPWCRERVMVDKVLVNSWGRRLPMRWRDVRDPHTFKMAYNFYPQSECADWMAQRGLRAVMRYIREMGMKSRVNLLVHDELVLSCPVEEVYEVARVLTASLERPLTIFGERLVIPCEVSVGKDWADVKAHSWKELPAREEMEGVCGGLLG